MATRALAISHTNYRLSMVLLVPEPAESLPCPVASCPAHHASEPLV